MSIIDKLNADKANCAKTPSDPLSKTVRTLIGVILSEIDRKKTNQTDEVSEQTIDKIICKMIEDNELCINHSAANFERTSQLRKEVEYLKTLVVPKQPPFTDGELKIVLDHFKQEKISSDQTLTVKNVIEMLKSEHPDKFDPKKHIGFVQNYLK